MSEQSTEQTADTPVEEAPQCAFPGCTVPPVPKDPTAPGRAPKYCSDPDHNPMSAYRAKRGKTGSTKSVAAEDPSDRIVSDAARTAGIVQGTVLQKVDELRTELSRYVDLLQTITDPEAAEAEVASVAATADQQVAEWRKKAIAANTERDAVLRQCELARAETKEAQEAADRAIELHDEGEARFKEETAKVRDKAEADVATAQEETRKVLADTRQQIIDIQAKADKAVDDAEERATEEIKEIEDEAGKAKVESDRQLRDMEETVEKEKAAAETAKAKAAQEVKVAQAELATAEEAARTAKADADKARQDAETRITAERELRTTLEATHTAELGRANDRVRDLEGQLTQLHTAVNETKDEKRELQTQLTLAQAEVKRLTPDDQRR